MTSNITQRTGTNGLQSSFAASSAATFSISTADPSLSTTLAPMLTVMLGFGRHAGLQAVPRGPSIPYRRPDPPQIESRPSEAVETDDAAPHHNGAGVENGAPEAAGAESDSPEAAATDSDRTRFPAEDHPPSEDEALELTSEGGSSRHRGEKRPRHAETAASPEPEPEPEPAAADPEPTAAAEPADEAERTAKAQPEAEPHPVKPATSNRLEMTIDSLPHHDLTAPIPIYIDPLGDAVFTATVANLDIMATGNSIGEALVLLKEQIEFIYNDLNRRHKPSPEQLTMLKMLHTYIAPKAAKPSWL